MSTSSGQSADWSQNLDLSVAGELSKGLKLNAALSDRSTQLTGQDRSDATRLGDLNRFFIEARSSRFTGRWGDLALGDVRNASQTRHAAGLKLDWNDRAHAATTYLGYASGETVRRTLAVQQQDAGPYRLIDRGSGTVNVVPGSVALWLDGRRLREGPTDDFLFDPNQGTITFNPSVNLGAHSVVVAEFEQSLDSYRRFLAGGGWSWADSARDSRNALAVRWESDDPGQPLFGSLSAAQKSALATNTTSQVTIPAAQYYGALRGDYRLDVAASGDSAFVYVGPGNGDWQVSFQWVGPNNGRYRHLAESAYEYVGKGGGSYEPTATLGAPQAQMNVSEAFSFDARALGRLDGVWAGTLHDANRLSNNSTHIFSDHRIRWSMGASGQQSGLESADRPSPGHLQLEWRRVSSADRSATGVDDLSRFLEAWGLKSALFDSSRNDYQMSASANPANTRIDVESGWLTLHDLNAWRVGLSSSTRFLKSWTTALEWRHRATDGTGIRQSSGGNSSLYGATLAFDPGPARIEGGWRENRLDDPGRLFEPAPDLTAARWISLGRGRVVTEYRWEDAHDSTAVWRRTREWSAATSLDFHSLSHGALTVARGQQAAGSGPYTPYYRGQLTERWQPSSILSLDADVRLLHGHSGLQQEVYLPTSPGQGQYRLERGEYVPDAHGDYRRVLTQSDDTNLDTYDGEQHLVASWRPDFAGWRWLIESQWERRSQYDPTRFRPGVWLTPWSKQGSALLFGSRSEQLGRYRVTAQPDQFTDLSADWQSDISLIGGEDQDEAHDQLHLSIRRHLTSSLYLQGEAQRDKRTRDGIGSAGIAAQATTLSATVGSSRSSGVNWSVEGRRRSEYEAVSDNAVLLWGIHPSLHTSIGALTILMETDGAWVTPGRQDQLLSALLAEGRPQGFSLTEFCELRLQLPGRITVQSRLNADLRENGADRWRWELETKAAF